MNKITTKMLTGYKRAKSEWISANDNYNKLHFGIVRSEYMIIDRCFYHAYGILTPTNIKLCELNKWLEISVMELAK